MSARIHLRRADIAAKVRRVLRGGTPRPVALYGTGEAGTLEIEHVLWTIVPVRSELELRVKLSETHADLAFVYLVDHDDRLPLDIACRLAGQKVHPVDRETRLAHLFGAKSVAPGFVATALADVLLDETPDLEPIDGTRIGPDDAWRRYLEARLDLTQPTVVGLLRKAFTQDDEGRAFANRRQDEPWTRVLAEASAWLERTSGPAAEVIWSAWMAGQGRTLLGWLIYIDAARRAGSRDAVRALRTRLRLDEKTDVRWLETGIAGPLCDALDVLLRGLDHGVLRRFLAEVVGLFSDEEFDPARRFSRWLPDGFDALQQAFADALSAALADASALPALHAAFADFDGHHSVEADASAQQAHAVRLAGARLATWLAWPTRHPVEHPGYADMETLARWYDQDGAWIDWARDELRLRSTGHAAVDAALKAVATRVGELRQAYDARFARATVNWYAARKPSTDVLPIERVTHDVVAQFLDGNPQRRLLIILLDGMSVPIATRLLRGGIEGWGLVPWCPHKHRFMPPAIAALPTLTKTSRAAFFAGKASKAHGNQAESKDRKRFEQNAALTKFAGAAGPRLFLKPELGAGNRLPDQVTASLNDDEERVVAVVVNAIDDQLKGSDQVDVRYESVESIPVLARLLRAAGDAGRAVLLVSDHGHIPAQVMNGQPHPDGGTKGGQRWRPLSAGERLVDGEIELPKGCWTPRGADRMAVLVDETRAWGRALSGAHGGLSMAETVIPLRLIAPNWLAQHLQPTDDELRTRDLAPPRWWTLATPPKARTRAQRVASVVKTPPKEASKQLELLAPAPALEPVVEEVVEEVIERHPLAVVLETAPRFLAQAADQPDDKREKALLFVDTLLRAKEHRMARAAFARSVGVKLRRLSSRIAYVGFLNSDGFAVIEDDTVGDQVRLHYDRLVTQYGLDP